MSFVAKALAST